ncbi:phosphotransferase family protein [Parafrankia sp. EUN1f]|uniref:phosphotransferase family protein n=1 Tax=Parafrankia sp. EUN1f TaxID=102897 RepID=UPI0001C43AAB|nr:phosphotransferase family protein [Parafrankia sp. EUN1f]EFC83471.1 aminoglycoside phosphotransferase [Parafrankia sp. EUN1f]
MSADDAAALPGRVLASLAGELDTLSAELTDGDVSARLRQAADLARWVRGRILRDPDLERDEALTLNARLADGAEPPEVGEALRRILNARSVPEPAERADRSGEVGIPALSTPEVTAYLRSSRDDASATAHSVRVMTGGFSKQTFLVDATLDGTRQELVFRQVPSSRRAGSLAPEFNVLKAVHAAGLPTPEPLWIESGDNALGGAFFVTRRAPGHTVGDVWGARSADVQLCLDVARFYARLHRMDHRDLTPPISPRHTPEQLDFMITWQMETLAKRGIVPEPELLILITWLRANTPQPAERASLIHGDAAFSNLLVDDGRISAVLDWEASHVGNAAEELAYLRSSVEPLLPWSQFLDAYQDAGGVVPDAQSLRYFAVWSHTWRYIGCLWLSQTYEQTGRYESAIAAYVNGPRFLQAAVDAAFPSRGPHLRRESE